MVRAVLAITLSTFLVLNSSVKSESTDSGTIESQGAYGEAPAASSGNPLGSSQLSSAMEEASSWTDHASAPMSAVGPTPLPDASKAPLKHAIQETGVKLAEKLKSQAPKVAPEEVIEHLEAAPSSAPAESASLSSELENSAAEASAETTPTTAAPVIDRQELIRRIVKLNNQSADDSVNDEELMDIRKQILEDTRRSYADIAPMTKRLQAVVSMFNDAFAKAQSIPLFDQEDPESLAPSPALEPLPQDFTAPGPKEAAAPMGVPETMSNLKQLKDLVDPEYLKATERITKALQALTDEAAAAPAASPSAEVISGTKKGSTRS